MIDDLVADIPRALQGVRLRFSAEPFARFQHNLEGVRLEMGGNWYRSWESTTESSLYPTLFR